MKQKGFIKKYWWALLIVAFLIFSYLKANPFTIPAEGQKQLDDAMSLAQSELADPANITNSAPLDDGRVITENDLQLASTVAVLADLEYSEETGLAVQVNNNIPFFTDAEKEQFITDYDANGWPIVSSYESYSDLDALGRCGTAFACIGQDIMPAEGEERGSISSIKPSGWVQKQYPDLIDRSNGYLYERCHLIAWSLAGENANEKNLITGTGYFNVDGMFNVCEEAVLTYLKDNPSNHVLYRVTPVFSGNDLVAKGVLMEAYSVEDGGAFQFCYYIFNVQPGIEIDYATGENQEVYED